MLDSIFRGYPLGSFLLWETNDFLKERNPLNLNERPQRPERQYLIDGQQRTIALYGVFTNNLRVGEEPKQIEYQAFFDLEDANFKLIKKNDIARNSELISETQISLDSAINYDLERRTVIPSQLIQDRILRAQNSTWNNNFQQLIRTYTQYVVGGILVQGVNLAEACEIFVRMNKSGVALNIVDLMVARTYSDNPYFNLREQLEEFNVNYATRGYQLKERTILQCVSGCIEGGISERDILNSAEDNKILTNWENCTRAINTALDFLQNNMVKISNFLPNEVILSPLSHYFYIRRRPSASHLRELKRYFWNVSISQRYIQGQNSKIREDIELMRNIIDEEEIAEIDYNVTFEDVKKQKLRLGSAFCKSILCMLSELNPQDWLTRQPINLISSFATANIRQFHHIFPKKYLKSMVTSSNYDEEIKPYIDSISNICILTALSNNIVGEKPPSQYISEIREDVMDIQRILNSHLISEEAYDRLISDDFTGFTTIRSRDIANKLNENLDFSMV